LQKALEYESSVALTSKTDPELLLETGIFQVQIQPKCAEMQITTIKTSHPA